MRLLDGAIRLMKVTTMLWRARYFRSKFFCRLMRLFKKKRFECWAPKFIKELKIKGPYSAWLELDWSDNQEVLTDLARLVSIGLGVEYLYASSLEALFEVNGYGGLEELREVLRKTRDI